MSFFTDPSSSWKELQTDSEQFQLPTHYQNNFEYNGELEDAIRDLLLLHATNETARNLTPQLRLYVNKQVVDVNRYFNSSTVIKQEESVKEWGKRIFNDQEYILVINCVERFSDSLSNRFADLMSHRLKDLPADEISYRITLFIGNSGFTPFGAHIDVSGLNVTHFHLGPGSKSMHLWKANSFQNITKSKEKHFHHFEQYLPEGKTYKINQGDVLFFPADKYYHVGEYHDFSIAATVGLMQENPLSLFSKAMNLWKEDNVPNIKRTIHADDTSSSELSHHIPNEIRSQSIQNILEEYKYKKASNAFMYNRPVLKKLRPLFIIGKELQLNPSFQIIVKDEIAYARGRKWNSPLNSESKQLLLQLSECKTISCRKDTNKKTLEFITWLFNAGSIRIK
jgi:uncharacterized protein involved in tolerance to divalent cations